jgi:hypothetical protein
LGGAGSHPPQDNTEQAISVDVADSSRIDAAVAVVADHHQLSGRNHRLGANFRAGEEVAGGGVAGERDDAAC